MFRWLLGGKEPQGGVEKTAVLNIGEEQIQNPYTELTALTGHHDIVRFLVQVDENRFASACDDGSVLVWDVQTGEILFEFHGHTQKITAIAVFPASETSHIKNDLILTASSDKTLIAWDCVSGQQWQKASNFHSTVKTLLIVQSLDVWLSAGSELRVWNRNFNLLGEAEFLSDGGIVALIELPKRCVAAAVGKDLIIFKIGPTVPGSDKWDIVIIKRLSGHRDVVRTVINVNEMTFVSSCDAGEMVVWDALDFSVQGRERNFPHMYAQQDSPPERRQLPTQEEVSIQHLSSDGECVYVAVGRGIYVYNLHTKRVIAFQKTAHDSSIQHMAIIPSRLSTLLFSGFFTMLGFGKGSKQHNQTVKKTNENGIAASLELIGDLIGHSSSVQMFLYFQDHGLVTCSADQLIILWKEGKRESRLRSLLLFQKLEQNGDLQPRYSLH
ncbi:PREDICTED: WD repeat-containing protein 41-like [Nanorana parkeri]|uniref:WD repeat-containing protein 41-like n=1 Tax=Nanorana parkeri TaxID=125878 RepID=UPI000854E813|nr:PREDICTED: WD repeat-containing protein 41-like [Nanorana parkeri]